MGGTVAVTIRKTDGREHRMARWTNVLPWFVENQKFLGKDTTHIQNYIAMWEDMRQDWIDNHETGNFRHNMTSCYGDHPYLAPAGYGLVVLDQQSAVILSMQGYTGTFGHFYSYDLMGWLETVSEAEFEEALEAQRRRQDFPRRVPDGHRPHRPHRPHQPHRHRVAERQKLPLPLNQNSALNFDLDRLHALWEAGRILGYRVPNPQGRGLKTMPHPKGEALYGYLKAIWAACEETNDKFYGFELDMAPFTVKFYPETAEGAKEMLSEIRKQGFVLSEKEESIWCDWMADEE